MTPVFNQLRTRKVPFAFAMRIISNVRCATDVSMAVNTPLHNGFTMVSL